METICLTKPNLRDDLIELLNRIEVQEFIRSKLIKKDPLFSESLNFLTVIRT